jgi:hypothetical protein
MRYLTILASFYFFNLCDAQVSLMKEILSDFNASNNSSMTVQADLDSLEQIEVEGFSKLFSELLLFKCKMHLTMGHHYHYETCFIMLSMSDSSFAIQKPYYWVGPNEAFWEKLTIDSLADSSVNNEVMINTVLKLFFLIEKEHSNERQVLTKFDSILEFQTLKYIPDPYPYFTTGSNAYCRIYERIDYVFDKCSSKTGYIYVPYLVVACDNIGRSKKIKLLRY